MRVRTPIGRLSPLTVVAANVVFWPTWTVAVGWAAARTPARRFAADDALTRLRGFERDGDWYRDRWQVQRWKDRLPERGGAFGGVSKDTVGAGDPDAMARLALETRRAEHAHWGMLGGVVLTAAWNPWWALPVNAAVGVASNVPCIAVQRYNRGRLLRVARRRAGAASRAGAG